MYDVRFLVENQTEVVPGKWGPAKPIPLRGWRGWRLRIKDAWAVLTGRCAAVRWF